MDKFVLNNVLWSNDPHLFIVTLIGIPLKCCLRYYLVRILANATQDTAGSDWFNLPKTDLTTEMKRDWQILRMRNVLDPKQQRKTLRAEPPKYSQVGEIVSGPADFYSGRITRKERKRNLLQEALSDRDETKFRNKYAGIQKDKTSGKKAFYKKLVSQRRKNKR